MSSRRWARSSACFCATTPKERPLTHDLINRMFQGFGITVERVVITDLKNSTYFARLILQQQNELARKIVEIGRAPERLPGHRRRAEKADFRLRAAV